MPQFCSGLQDPAGGSPRPCIFAAEGDGQPAAVKQRRDGPQCAFCSPDAFDKAYNSRCGKGHVTHKLKSWKKKRSPVFEAAFQFGMPGLLLPLELQYKLRRMAGERPKFDKSKSWPHKQQARLKFFRRGKPIPPQPVLTADGEQFLLHCENPRDSRNLKGLWVEKLRYKVREYAKRRRHEPNATTENRRKWWRLRRELRKLLLPALAEGPAAIQAIKWAAAEGIVTAADYQAINAHRVRISMHDP